jgi:hypothetical protein
LLLLLVESCELVPISCVVSKDSVSVRMFSTYSTQAEHRF